MYGSYMTPTTEGGTMNPLQEKKSRLCIPSLSRRDFLTKAVPGCAIGCLGFCGAMSLAAKVAAHLPDPEKHKFDKEFPFPLTVRQYMSRQVSGVIEPLKAIQSEIGEERLLRILHDYSIRRSAIEGEKYAKQYPRRDFPSYIARFRDEQMKSIITCEIVEDSDTVFEIKVTECILVQPVLELDAGKIGNALFCDGDYGHVQGYNPKIKLIRDKTLTLGHDYCNHRYVLQG
jgi:hypothetical protein